MEEVPRAHWRMERKKYPMPKGMSVVTKHKTLPQLPARLAVGIFKGKFLANSCALLSLEPKPTTHANMRSHHLHGTLRCKL